MINKRPAFPMRTQFPMRTNNSCMTLRDHHAGIADVFEKTDQPANCPPGDARIASRSD
jgi:hypothetical protein